MKITATGRRWAALVMIVSLAWPQALLAQQAVDESPSAGAMAGDLLVARPIGVVMTVGGAAAFLVSLPFTLLAGHASEAADTLMIGPAQSTFMRCLGCREIGYTNKDVERYEEMTREEAAE